MGLTMKLFTFLFLAVVFSCSFALAQDDAPTEEQLVIKVDHANVDHLQQMLVSATKSKIRVLSDANALSLIHI